MKADEKETNLYWRGGRAYFRRRIAGRDHWESLGELAPQSARVLVREKRRESSAAAYLDRWGTAKARQGFATIGELCAAYLDFSGGADQAERTALGYCGALRRLIAESQGRPAAEADGLSCRLLTSGTVLDFEHGRIATARASSAARALEREEAEEELATALRTIHSTAQQARAVTARRALQSAQLRALHLPDLAGWQSAKVGAQTIRRFRRWPAPVIAAVRDGMPMLRQSSPGAWAAARLALIAGLRASSIREARWSWLEERDGKTWLRIAVAKGNGSTVEIDPADRAELAAVADNPTYIVPGDRAAACVQLCAWLRSCGVSEALSRAPVHDLRKLHGDARRRLHGLDNASAALGHSDPALTAGVYSGAVAPGTVRGICC